METNYGGRRVILAVVVIVGALVAVLAVARNRWREPRPAPGPQPTAAPQPAGEVTCATPQYRSQLGADSEKIKRENGRTLLWAGGGAPDGPDAEWYDFTDASIPPDQLQFGIGKDTIRAIDDPLFVKPDDPRLLQLPPSPYRREQRPETNDEIMVIGYANGADVRAYPVALLDRHELVNDQVGGKPVTVGW